MIHRQKKISHPNFIRNSILALLFVALILVPYFINSTAQVVAENKSVAILYTNDEQANSENMSQIAALREERISQGKDVILLGGGNTFNDGSRDLEKALNMAAAMNEAGYDAVVPGEKDFAFTQRDLNKIWLEAEFEIVLANIDTEGVVLNSPSTYWEAELADDLKIIGLGLIQVGEEGYPLGDVVSYGGLNFFSPFKIAEEYSHLKERADILIGMTHLGHTQERQLANWVDEFDLILGGYSRTITRQPALINDTLVAQTGEKTNYLGEIILEFNEYNELIAVRADLIDLRD